MKKVEEHKIQNDSLQPNSKTTTGSVSGATLTDADLELEEYNILDNHETSVFCLHFLALIRKRILMQIRD